MNLQFPAFEQARNQDQEELSLVTHRELAGKIKNNMHTNKTPGFDIVTGKILNQLPRKGIIMLTYY